MKTIRLLLVIATIFQLAPSSARALPFNDDMVGNQLIVGSVMRPKPPGSVALGTLSRKIESREAALSFENPMKNDSRSSARGERLFATNCSPCHGGWKNMEYHPSVILKFGMPSMDLASKSIMFYPPPKDSELKPDGHYFGYAYFGGPLMPGYGSKLDNGELWDIVSYIRSVQNQVLGSASSNIR